MFSGTNRILKQELNALMGKKPKIGEDDPNHASWHGEAIDKAALVNTAINLDDFPEDGEYGSTTPAQYEFVIASLNQR